MGATTTVAPSSIGWSEGWPLCVGEASLSKDRGDMATAATGCEALFDGCGERATEVWGEAGFRSSLPVADRVPFLHAPRRVIGAVALLGLTLAGCERPQDTIDKDLYIAELEAQVTQLNSDLNGAYQEVLRLSNNLTGQVTNLETALTDLNLRVMDLPGAVDQNAAIREVEARMAVAMQRLAELRGTSATLAEYLE